LDYNYPKSLRKKDLKRLLSHLLTTKHLLPNHETPAPIDFLRALKFSRKTWGPTFIFYP
jgi:hypothetical protein